VGFIPCSHSSPSKRNCIRDHDGDTSARAQKEEKYGVSEIKEGDLVLLHHPLNMTQKHAKLIPFFTGPHFVLKKIGDSTFEIDFKGRKIVANSRRLVICNADLVRRHVRPRPMEPTERAQPSESAEGKRAPEAQAAALAGGHGGQSVQDTKRVHPPGLADGKRAQGPEVQDAKRAHPPDLADGKRAQGPEVRSPSDHDVDHRVHPALLPVSTGSRRVVEIGRARPFDGADGERATDEPGPEGGFEAEAPPPPEGGEGVQPAAAANEDGDIQVQITLPAEDPVQSSKRRKRQLHGPAKSREHRVQAGGSWQEGLVLGNKISVGTFVILQKHEDHILAKVLSTNVGKTIFTAQRYRRDRLDSKRFYPLWVREDGTEVATNVSPSHGSPSKVKFKTSEVLCSGFAVDQGRPEDKVLRLLSRRRLTVAVVQNSKAERMVTMSGVRGRTSQRGEGCDSPFS